MFRTSKKNSSLDLCKSVEIAAAIGSSIILLTSSPAILAASSVAFLYVALKLEGTVKTATSFNSLTPRNSCTAFFMASIRIMLICSMLNVPIPCTFTIQR